MEGFALRAFCLWSGLPTEAQKSRIPVGGAASVVASEEKIVEVAFLGIL
jgi:hypothetical protein